MSVFKRTTSRGETEEYHYSFMQGGSRYWGVCEGCTTERAAQAYEKKIRDTVKTASEQHNIKALIENFREKLTGGETISLAEAYERYLAKPKKRIPGEKQVKQNRSYFNDFIAFMTAKYPEVTKLAEVTQKHAGEYLTMLRESGAFSKTVNYTQNYHHNSREISYTRHNNELSPRSCNAYHKILKAVFAWLKDDAGILRNPFDFPLLDNKSISRSAFTDEELLRIGKAMTMPYTQPIFTVGLCTGLTLGDICLLRWDEIQGDWITNKHRRKTGTSLEIPILPPLAAFLEQQRPVSGDQEYVAPELAAMYQTNPSGVNYRLKQFLKEVGIVSSQKIEGRSQAVSTKAAHAMRHTFAYLAGVYNVPQPIVQAILGHMSPAMTALYQEHANREAKEKFLKQIPNLLGAPIAPRKSLPQADSALEPERAELHRLADALPIEVVREIVRKLSNPPSRQRD